MVGWSAERGRGRWREWNGWSGWTEGGASGAGGASGGSEAGGRVDLHEGGVDLHEGGAPEGRMSSETHGNLVNPATWTATWELWETSTATLVPRLDARAQPRRAGRPLGQVLVGGRAPQRSEQEPGGVSPGLTSVIRTGGGQWHRRLPRRLASPIVPKPLASRRTRLRPLQSRALPA